MEQWKTIRGFEDYQVSTSGKVKSTKFNKERLLKPSTKRDGGHQRVGLFKDGKRHSFEVQTLVALMFIGERPKDNVVRHLDGNPKNNRLDNLAYGTHAANHKDAVEHGTVKDNHLLEQQVDLIAYLRSLNYQAKELAEMFGVTKCLIYKQFKKLKVVQAY